MGEFVHRSVLLDECIESLAIRSDGVYVDGTAGGGGVFCSPSAVPVVASIEEILRIRSGLESNLPRSAPVSAEGGALEVISLIRSTPLPYF